MSDDVLRRLRAALSKRYSITRELGRGGMAFVFLARDLKHERPVAIKVLRPDIAMAIGADRFLREIQLTARLTHPHILPLLDSGKASGLLYYVMPYVAGETLRARLERERQLPLDDALHIAREVADALSYAHSSDVVHRDIKPENILLESGHAVVADFGIARAITAAGGERLTESGVAVGTPWYMSPEQESGERVLDGRSDVYSLGCVLYEMLAGEPPYTGRTAQAIAARRLADPVLPLRNLRETVPAEVERAITKALAKTPADRFATAMQFAEALTPKSPAENDGVVAAAHRIRPRTVLGLGVAILALLGSVALLRRGGTPTTTDPSVVVVFPFRITGADPSLAYMREGLVELLAVKLTGEGGPRAVHPGVALTAWRQQGGSLANDLDRDAAKAVARRLGADRFIDGAIVGTPARMVINASLVRLTGRQNEPPTSVEGPLDSLSMLVDLLTARLLASEAGQTERLASLATTSLPALRAYLDGQAAHRRGSYRQAVDHLQRALQLDSTFALAGLVLATAARRCCYEFIDRGLRPAWAARDRLSARDRALVEAQAGPRYPDPAPRVEDLKAWEQAVAAVPDGAEAWYGMGDLLFQWGPVLGLPDAQQRASAAFKRALELDSTLAGPLQRLVDISATSGDTAGVRRLGTLALVTDTATEIAGYLRWRIALALGDSEMLRELRANLTRMADQSLGEIILSGQYDGVGLKDVDRAVGLLQRRASARNEQEGAFLIGWIASMNSGRPGAAVAAHEGWRRTVTLFDPQFPLQLRVLDAIYWQGDTLLAERAVRELASFADAPLASGLQERSRQYGNICTVAQWRLAHGQLGGIERAISQLRSAALPKGYASYVRTTVNTEVCAAVLHAWLRTVQRSTDAAHALRALDSLLITGPEPWLVIQYPNLLSARLHDWQRDLPGALTSLRRRHHSPGGPMYLSSFLREEGRVAALTGDRDGAIRAYRHYLALRHDPEPAVRPEVDRVRAELAILERGRP